MPLPPVSTANAVSTHGKYLLGFDRTIGRNEGKSGSCVNIERARGKYSSLGKLPAKESRGGGGGTALAAFLDANGNETPSSTPGFFKEKRFSEDGDVGAEWGLVGCHG